MRRTGLSAEYVNFSPPIRPFLTFTPRSAASTRCRYVYVCVHALTHKRYPSARRYERVYAGRVHSSWERRHIRRICASPFAFFGISLPPSPPPHLVLPVLRDLLSLSPLVLTCHHMTPFFLRSFPYAQNTHARHSKRPTGTEPDKSRVCAREAGMLRGGERKKKWLPHRLGVLSVRAKGNCIDFREDKITPLHWIWLGHHSARMALLCVNPATLTPCNTRYNAWT